MKIKQISQSLDLIFFTNIDSVVYIISNLNIPSNFSNNYSIQIIEEMVII